MHAEPLSIHESAPLLAAQAVLHEANRWRPGMVTAAFAMIGDWGAAEDVAQEALMVVQRRWAEFEPGSSMWCWVKQIVHFKCLELRRRRGREVALADEDLHQLIDNHVLEHKSATGGRVG